ncbi:hypothetical protein EDB80DRAFT_220945 [Ilyonectria destructans]|nr:hypothetical protein EDB80DRAFT_220945 [Ilyonectria destructans]
MLLSLALGFLAADCAVGGLCKHEQSGSTSASTTPAIPTPTPPAPTIAPTTTSTTSIVPTPTSTTSIVPTTTSETTVSSSLTVPLPPVDPGFIPIANFKIVAGGGPGSPMAGSVLQGNGRNTHSPMFNPTGDMSPIAFTIEAGTGRVIQSNGLYLCGFYSFQPNYPSELTNCPTEGTWDTIPYYFITCEQTADRKLVCSVPAVICTSYYSEEEIVTSCIQTHDKFDQFYTSLSFAGGYNVYLGSGSYNGMVAVDFKVEAVEIITD